MHLLCVGYPLATVIYGAVICLYNELQVGPGCWIVNFPENCGTGRGKSGETCTSTYYTYAYAAAPVAIVIFSLIGNHASIYRHVFKTSLRTSFSNIRGSTASQRQSRAVATHTFLYVGAFVICYIWSLVLRILEARPVSIGASDQDKIFPLLCLQMIFLPSQGLLNLFVVLRPHVNLVRSDFKHERYIWIIRRALFGDAIKPTRRTLTSSADPTVRQSSSSNPAQQGSSTSVPPLIYHKSTHSDVAEEITALPPDESQSLAFPDVSTAFFMPT